MRRFDPKSRFSMTIINLLLLFHSLLTFFIFLVFQVKATPLESFVDRQAGGEKRIVYIYTRHAATSDIWSLVPSDPSQSPHEFSMRLTGHLCNPG